MLPGRHFRRALPIGCPAPCPVPVPGCCLTSSLRSFCADVIAREVASSLREVRIGLAHVFSEWRQRLWRPIGCCSARTAPLCCRLP